MFSFWLKMFLDMVLFFSVTRKPRSSKFESIIWKKSKELFRFPIQVRLYYVLVCNVYLVFLSSLASSVVIYISMYFMFICENNFVIVFANACGNGSSVAETVIGLILTYLNTFLTRKVCSHIIMLEIHYCTTCS